MYLNGSTAIQNPSSSRAAPESGAALRGGAAAGARSASSLATSRAVWIRLRASFSRQRPTRRASAAGTSARRPATPTGVSRMIAETSSAEDAPWNGRRPVAIS